MMHLARGHALVIGSILLTGCAATHRTSPTQPESTSLADTAWRVVQFRGADDTILVPDDKAKYTIEFKTGGQLSARIDCNRGTGTWTSARGSQLTLGPLKLTGTACPPSPLTDRLVKDWTYVHAHRMRDGRLFLSLAGEGGTYELEPMSATEAVVKGIATYPEHMDLPAGAVLEAVLEDVSTTDGEAEVLGTARVEELGDRPIPFQIRYDPSRIEQSHRYLVRARILANGNPLLLTDPPSPVLTQGAGSEVEVVLRPD